jgi:hypothetical protein
MAAPPPLLQKERVLELLRQAEVEHEVYEHAEVATADAQVRAVGVARSAFAPPPLSLAHARHDPLTDPTNPNTPPQQVQALAHVEGVTVTKNLFLRVRGGVGFRLPCAQPTPTTPTTADAR